MTDKTVSRWERGTTLPDVEMLKKLSIVIGLDLNDIFDQIEVKINENEEVIDLESIKKYRIGYICTSLLFIFAAVLFFMINSLPYSNSDATLRVLYPVFFIISMIMIMAALILYAVSLVKFHAAFSVKEYKRKYIREVNISIVIILASIVLIITSLII